MSTNEHIDIEAYIIRYLDGSINEEDSKILLSWLQSSVDNQRLFMQYYNLWDFSGSEKISFDENKALELFLEKIHNTPKAKPKVYRINIFKYVAAAACMAGLIFLSINYFSNLYKESDILIYANQQIPTVADPSNVQLVLSKEKVIVVDDKSSSIQYDTDVIKINEVDEVSKKGTEQYNQLIVPYGKHSSLLLDDGTKIWVNAGTRVIYPIEFGSTREIFVDGEIFLDVAKDAARPFIVKTNNLDIEVLGTTFNVCTDRYDEINNVVLVSGSVKILGKNKKDNALLSPGQKYTLENNRHTVSNVDVSRYVQWIHGYYILESDKLIDIAKYLFRLYVIDVESVTSVMYF